MVSYGELIYQFTEIYLKTAVECSICKENYIMVDDVEFLDDYMKLFVSLLTVVEKNSDTDMETIRETLRKRRDDEIREFNFFLRHKVAEQALEKIEKDRGLRRAAMLDDKTYMAEIRGRFQDIFDEGSSEVKNRPVELLRYVRTNEERVKEGNNRL